MHGASSEDEENARLLRGGDVGAVSCGCGIADGGWQVSVTSDGRIDSGNSALCRSSIYKRKQYNYMNNVYQEFKTTKFSWILKYILSK